jgi:hypothetical protein
MLFRHHKHVHKHTKNGLINIIKTILENNNEIKDIIFMKSVRIIYT